MLSKLSTPEKGSKDPYLEEHPNYILASHGNSSIPSSLWVVQKSGSSPGTPQVATSLQPANWHRGPVALICHQHIALGRSPLWWQHIL